MGTGLKLAAVAYLLSPSLAKGWNIKSTGAYLLVSSEPGALQRSDTYLPKEELCIYCLKREKLALSSASLIRDAEIIFI